MGKLKSTEILFFCFIISCRIFSRDNVLCSSTRSINYPIQWSGVEGESKTISNPICPNENQEFVYRECSNEFWTSELKFSYSQLKNMPQCPEKFCETDNMCFKMVRNVTFPYNCPYEEVLPFKYYENIEFLEPIWVPVKRDLSNGLGFLQWIEASILYRTFFNEQYFISEPIQNKDCMVLGKNKSFQVVSCAERYTGICAYKKLNQLDVSLCLSSDENLCKQSDFSPKSKCFCVGGSGDNFSLYNKADFIYSYQNYVYSLLTADDCTFGLKKTSNGSYIWTSSNIEIDYTFWAKDVIFDDTHIYGAQTKNGWVLTPTPNPCFLYQIDIQAPKSQLDLYFDENLQVFSLNVTNLQGIKRGESNIPLIFCFTDASSWSLLYRYPLIDPNYLNLEIVPTFHGPGHYWCEGFTYPDNMLLKTSVFFYKPKNFGSEYVTILKISYIIGTDPLGSYLTEFLERILSLSLSSVEELKNYISRIMKIESLDENAKQVIVNVHFTRRNPSSDEDEEYSKLKDIVYTQLGSIEAVEGHVLDFRSTDYCPGITILNETWPKTVVNASAFSQKYCFFLNGTRAGMWCVGNFINGAFWQQIYGCTYQNHTEITDDLENLLEQARLGNFSLDDLNSLLQISSNLQPLDTYLLFQILTNLKNIEPNILYGLVVILLNIDDYVLWQSQSVMKATDAILSFLTSINVSTRNYSDFCMFSGETFTETTTILLVRDDNNHVLIQETKDFTDTFVTNITDLEFAVSWTGFSQGTFMYFDKDAFFQENLFNEKVNHNIFGVLFSQSRNIVSSIKIIFRITNTEQICMSWKTDNMGDGYWDESDGKLTNIDAEYGVCEFRTSGFHVVKEVGFAYSTTFSEYTDIDSTTNTVTNSGNTNVTDDLCEVLSSNSTSLIYELLNITERYKEFNPFDVLLVGKILERMMNDSDLDLQALTYVINNMHKIKHEVLLESQQLYTATDEILYSLDEILKSHKYQSQINFTSENFFVMIADLIVTNITGIVLLNENDTVSFHLLQQNFSIDELVDYYPNFESGLVLSVDLLDQLQPNQTIIITVFANDSLFNEEKKTAKYVSRIFGVILPQIGEFLGPVSIIHNIMPEYQEQCVHWFYNKTISIPGSWKQDCNGKNLSQLIHCEFWHTTHFALLLLDHDIYDNDVLDWITTINCILSLFGACCIILTAICFKRWRSNTGNQVLLNFVVAIILEIGIFYGSNTVKNLSDNELVCTIIGAALHYCIVSQFCWMFIIAILQFKRFVEVFTKPPKYVLLKACLCGWVLPILPVTCVVILDDNNYTKGNSGLCYPSGLGLYLGVWLPVAIIVVINFVIFLFIIYNIVHRKTECVVDAGNSDVIFQWKLAILLFFMLGLTWIFGFLSEFNWGIVFVYLFCITATLQGFVMFLFFIVFNTGTRYLYVQVFRNCFHSKEF